MSYTAPELLMIIAAVGVFAGTVFTGIVSVIAARRTGKTAAAVIAVQEQVVTVQKKVGSVEEKVGQVGEQLDGRLTQWKEETSKFVEMAVQRARALGRDEGREDIKGRGREFDELMKRVGQLEEGKKK